MGERVLSPGARRLAVLAMYGAALAGFALLGALGSLRSLPGALGVAALFGVSLAAFGVLFAGTRYWRWGHAPDPGLDEFEVVSRNRAYLGAYRILGAAGLLALVWTQMARDNGWWLPNGLELDVLVSGYLLVILTLPAALLAWEDRGEA